MNTYSKSVDSIQKKNTTNKEETEKTIEMQDIDSSPFQDDFFDHEGFVIDGNNDLDNRQGSKNNAVHVSSTEGATHSTTTRPLMTDVDGDKLSYKEFLKALYHTTGAPQLLLLCIFMSFGYGTFAIAPAITSDRYARLLYGYEGPLCSLSTSEESDAVECTRGSDAAQRAAAYATFFQYALSFITSPLAGSLSDRWGRKVFMLVGVFLFNLGPFFLLLVQIIPTMDPIWYFVANSTPGLLSWFGISLTVMSDVVPPGLRAPALSLIQIFSFSATSFVPLLSVIFGHFGSAFISAVFCVLGFLYAIFFLPETLTDDNKQEAIRMHNEALGRGQSSFHYLLRPIEEMAILNKNECLRRLPMIVVLSGMVVAGDRIILLFYVQGQLGFTDANVSALVLLHSFVALCVQTFLLKKLVQKVGERHVVIVSMAFGVVYNFLYGISTTTSIIMIAIAISAITGMSYPVASSIMSFNVEEHEQGKIQGVFFSLTALSNAIGPISMQFVYDQTSNGSFFGPGTMFLMASVFYIIGTIYSYALPPELANSKNIQLRTPTNEKPSHLFEEENENTSYFA